MSKISQQQKDILLFRLFQLHHYDTLISEIFELEMLDYEYKNENIGKLSVEVFVNVLISLPNSSYYFGYLSEGCFIRYAHGNNNSKPIALTSLVTLTGEEL